MKKTRWIVAVTGAVLVAGSITGTAAMASPRGPGDSRHPGFSASNSVQVVNKKDGGRGQGVTALYSRSGGDAHHAGRPQPAVKRHVEISLVLGVKEIGHGKKQLVAHVKDGSVAPGVKAVLLKYDGHGKWKAVAASTANHGKYVFLGLPGKYRVVISHVKGHDLVSNIVEIGGRH
jgi:hypothetical protein